MTAVKTAETIESQTQSVSQYPGLPNYAENQRVVAEMSVLGEVATGVARLADAHQPAGLDIEADSMEVDTAKVTGHCAKRPAVAACDDGGPEGRPIRIDDCENTNL